MIVLAGGAGQHLWPLANSSRAEQFIPLLGGPSGRESMVQRIWRQLGEAGLRQYAHLSLAMPQVEQLRKQVGHAVPLIMEPERRGTYPAVALAAAYLYSIAGVSLGETVVVIPANMYVDHSFFDCIRSVPKLLRSSGADLMLVGVSPEGPEDRLPLIIPDRPGEGEASYYRVSSFIKKPMAEKAAGSERTGAFRHSGVFAFQLRFMIDRLMDTGHPVHYEELYKQYGKLRRKSFEESIRSSDRTAVMEYAGECHDLGSWDRFSSCLTDKQIGTGTLNECDDRTQLINELGLPVSVVGLSNVIVAASRDGILIADKSSGGLKEAGDGRRGKARTEEKLWGHSEVLESFRYAGGREATVKHMRMKAGANLSYELHFNRNEVWTILNGEAELILDESYSRLKAGDTVQIPPRTRHSLKALTDLEWIELQMGKALSDEDEIKIAMAWEEIG